MIVMQDYDYALDTCRHYREILKALCCKAVVDNQMQVVGYLSLHLKPMMTQAEQDSFREVLKSAKGAAKANAEAAEAVVANNLRKVVSHVPQGDMFNGDGGAAVVNPVPPPPIKPNDGAAVALPIPAKREARKAIACDAGLTF